MLKNPFILILIILTQFFVSIHIFGQGYVLGYVLLEPLPTSDVPLEETDLTGYLEWLFAFGISVAGLAAVVSTLIGGIQYITAYGNPGAIENAKNRITQALLGLLLVICAWLILYTINPNLIKGVLNIPSI